MQYRLNTAKEDAQEQFAKAKEFYEMVCMYLLD